MPAIRPPKDIEFRLRGLAAETGRTKALYVREAILHHLDEIEDKYLAINRLENSGKRWALEELEQNGVVMRDYPKKQVLCARERQP